MSASRRLALLIVLKVLGPIAGSLLGVGLISTGVVLIAQANDTDDLRTFGIVTGLIGLPIAELSTVLLQQRVAKRRAIEHEILGVRLQTGALAAGELRILFF